MIENSVARIPLSGESVHGPDSSPFHAYFDITSSPAMNKHNAIALVFNPDGDMKLGINRELYDKAVQQLRDLRVFDTADDEFYMDDFAAALEHALSTVAQEIIVSMMQSAKHIILWTAPAILFSLGVWKLT